jgi:hypothetical protein
METSARLPFSAIPVGKPHRVVALAREIRRVDVVVGVEGDDPLVDGARPRDQILIGLRRGSGRRRNDRGHEHGTVAKSMDLADVISRSFLKRSLGSRHTAIEVATFTAEGLCSFAALRPRPVFRPVR